MKKETVNIERERERERERKNDGKRKNRERRGGLVVFEPGISEKEKEWVRWIEFKNKDIYIYQALTKISVPKFQNVVLCHISKQELFSIPKKLLSFMTLNFGTLEQLNFESTRHIRSLS